MSLCPSHMHEYDECIKIIFRVCSSCNWWLRIWENLQKKNEKEKKMAPPRLKELGYCHCNYMYSMINRLECGVAAVHGIVATWHSLKPVVLLCCLKGQVRTFDIENFPVNGDCSLFIFEFLPCALNLWLLSQPKFHRAGYSLDLGWHKAAV